MDELSAGLLLICVNVEQLNIQINFKCVQYEEGSGVSTF